jgi:uncharacterized protein (DUF2235 family)
MRTATWIKWAWRKMRRGRTEVVRPATGRGRVDHVILLDGTMSSLFPGAETNVGLTYKLLREMPRTRMSLRYEAGVQWADWRTTMDVVHGRGINRAIRRAYGHLASKYQPGDRIFLFGYSRGAYAVRSLAGVIDRVGLVRAECATERAIRDAYRHYEINPHGLAAKAFKDRYCHVDVPIEMIGAWDTVKALGLRLPLLWMLTEWRHAFHSAHLGNSVRHGYHALAIDETRSAFAPVVWESTQDWPGLEVEQMWFRGSHGDVGGQLGGFDEARPLSNIPLVWMLEKAEACGLSLPQGWRGRFPTDADAPSAGTVRGWGKLFVARRRRVVGRDPSEYVHASARKGRRRARIVGALSA